MDINVSELKEKFEKDVFEHLNKENFFNIIKFLQKEDCDFIEDIITNYLDLFTIDYETFVNQYHRLNANYHGQFLKKAS